MEQIELKFNEAVVTGQNFRKLVKSVVKDWLRISGWNKIIDASEGSSITINSKVIKGKTFPNCNYKGRIAEFK